MSAPCPACGTKIAEKWWNYCAMCGRYGVNSASDGTEAAPSASGAPAEGEMVEEVARAMSLSRFDGTSASEEDRQHCANVSWTAFTREARAAIAAIRPRIEAEERERAAEVALEYVRNVAKGIFVMQGPAGIGRGIAAAIRKGNG